jgi:hypothetical protein
MHMSNIVQPQEINFVIPDQNVYLGAADEAVGQAPEVSASVTESHQEPVSEWVPVDIDPQGVLPADGSQAPAPVPLRPAVPYVPGRPNAVDPVHRMQMIALAADPQAVIDGLNKAVASYDNTATPVAVTARTILAELRHGRHSRHDGEYIKRLHDAQTIAAHLLRTPVTH